MVPSNVCWGMCRARSMNSGDALRAIAGFRGSIGEPAAYTEQTVFRLASVVLAYAKAVLAPPDSGLVVEAPSHQSLHLATGSASKR
jgi:hypothetical protein